MRVRSGDPGSLYAPTCQCHVTESEPERVTLVGVPNRDDTFAAGKQQRQMQPLILFTGTFDTVTESVNSLIPVVSFAKRVIFCIVVAAEETGEAT